MVYVQHTLKLDWTPIIMREKAEKCLKFSFSQKKKIPLTMAPLDALYTYSNVLENDWCPYSLVSPDIEWKKKQIRVGEYVSGMESNRQSN